jgi:hypothetical protein
MQGSSERASIPVEGQVHSIALYMLRCDQRSVELARDDVIGLDVQQAPDRAAISADAAFGEPGISHGACNAPVGTDIKSDADEGLLRPVDYDFSVSAPGSNHAGIGHLST